MLMRHLFFFSLSGSRKRDREDEQEEEAVVARRESELQSYEERQRKLMAEAEATSSVDMKAVLKDQAARAARLADGLSEEINGSIAPTQLSNM